MGDIAALGGIVLSLGAAILWISMRDDAPSDGMPVALAPRQDAGTETIAQPPTGASPQAARVRAAATWRMLVYRGIVRDRLPSAEDYELIARAEPGTLDDTEEWRGRAEVTLVFEADHRRINVPAHAAEDLAGALERAALQVRAIDVREAEHDEPIEALLIDAAGRPLGPVGATSRLALPIDLRGWAVAPGHVAAELVVTPELVRARLHRAAWVTGRVRGATWRGGFLRLQHLGDGIGPARRDAVRLEADGEFAFGPIAAGETFLSLEGVDGMELPPALATVVLQPGHQDLGTLLLDVLHGLHLAIECDDGKPFDGSLLASIHPQGRAPSQGLCVDRHEVRAGCLTLPRFRDVPLSLTLWTEDGRLGTGPSDGLLARTTSVLRPATIVLGSPGEVIAEVSTAPFAVPPGTALLACPTPYHLVRSAFAGDPAGSIVQRVRWCDASSGSARFAGMWPGPTLLGLVSAHGTILAQTEVNVLPGIATAVALAPAGRLAALDVVGPAGGCRFALVHVRGGVVLRAHASPQPQRFLIAGDVYEVRSLDPQRPLASRSIAVVAGEVRTLVVE